MRKFMILGTAAILLLGLFGVVLTGKNSGAVHPDYVPDERTATKIAEAVLIAQFGEDRVKAQLPLHAHTFRKGVWMVEGNVLLDSQGNPQVGGNFGVWIKKYDGCLSVIEHMK